MKNLNKLGAYAALIDAATYIIGIAVLVTFLSPAEFADSDHNQSEFVSFLIDNQTLLYIWNLIIYVVNAVFLAILAVALSRQLHADTPALAQLSLIFGTIWATLVLAAGMVANVGFAEVVRLHATSPEEATTLWNIVSTIENGLGGGNEIAGGVWALVLGFAFLVSTTFSKPLAYFSMLIGLAGLSTVLPGMSDIGGPIFGLGFIAWFIWVGITLLRTPTNS